MLRRRQQQTLQYSAGHRYHLMQNSVNRCCTSQWTFNKQTRTTDASVRSLNTYLLTYMLLLLITLASSFCCSLDLSFFFSLPRRLFGRSPPNFAMCLTMIQIYNIQSEIWGPSPKLWRLNNIKISGQFQTTLRVDRKYLRNATRYRQTENSVANCTCTQ